MADEFDVVVVGARCAGSPLATLLARAGLRVAVAERATFPCDTLSTHMFQAPGINFLRRLGVLEKVEAAGSVALGGLDFRQDEFHIDQPFPFRPGDAGGFMSVRRLVLDPLLADAAAEAGAEVMMATTVTGLVRRNGRVAGVRVTADGAERELSARLVVGADGRNSTVAKLTGARKYHVVPGERFGYWGFFEGADPGPEPKMVFHFWDGRAVIACPSDSGLYQVITLPENRFLPDFRADLDGAFMDHVRACAPVAASLTGATRAGKLRGMLRFESFFRESAGPGWALAGDAGQFKDPAPGQGMTDAFRQVAALAPAIVGGIDGSDPELDAAVEAWAKWRNRDAFEHHWLCSDTGSAGRSPAVLSEMMRRAADRGEFDRFFEIFQHRAMPSQVVTPVRLLSGTASLLARRGCDRRAVLREVGGLVTTNVRRERLRRAPVFVDSARPADAGGSEVAPELAAMGAAGAAGAA
jgi:2-polyprenyl-6-methoxyphenol hydroxylase-like FAD-dependent oxidoreductase